MKVKDKKEKMVIGSFQKFFVIDCNELNSIVRKKYKKLKKYDFALMEMCDNDSWHVFDVLGDFSDSEETVRLNYNQGKLMMNYEVLDLLALDGVIPKGKCLVSVCW